MSLVDCCWPGQHEGGWQLQDCLLGVWPPSLVFDNFIVSHSGTFILMWIGIQTWLDYSPSSANELLQTAVPKIPDKCEWLNSQNTERSLDLHCFSNGSSLRPSQVNCPSVITFNSNLSFLLPLSSCAMSWEGFWIGSREICSLVLFCPLPAAPPGQVA